ncbi:MAG: hypothetical protein K2J80_09585 [Oscillospiraceae bacterium]|nr:hypothetical protein [Oscillospiraceae bacterium]
MKRKSFGKLVLKGIGFVVFGNVLCLVMTMAIFMFGSHVIIKMLAIIFAVLIFFSLMFTVAWTDGARERKIVSLHPELGEQRYRWIAIGAVMFALAAAPTVFLLINKLFFPESDNLIIYQFVSGSAYPFVIAFTPKPESLASDISRVETMSALLPSLLLVYYALIPAVTQLGFWAGYRDKINTDRIMYK